MLKSDAQLSSYVWSRNKPPRELPPLPAVLQAPFYHLVSSLLLVSFLVLGGWPGHTVRGAEANPVCAPGDPDPICYVPTDSSRFLIEGQTNVHGFTCLATNIEGFVQLPEARSDRANPYPVVPEVEALLHVLIRSFECGKRRMNRDLYEALKADRHPYIRVTVKAVTVRDTPSVSEDPGTYRLEVSGSLAISDSTRKVRFELRGRRIRSGLVRGAGTLELEMSDFGIEPPSAVLGLIQVKNEITVRFDIEGTSGRRRGS